MDPIGRQEALYGRTLYPPCTFPFVSVIVFILCYMLVEPIPAQQKFFLASRSCATKATRSHGLEKGTVRSGTWLWTPVTQGRVGYHNTSHCFGLGFLLLVFCCSCPLDFDLHVKLSKLKLKPGSFHKLDGEDEEVVVLLPVSCCNGGCLQRQGFIIQME